MNSSTHPPVPFFKPSITSTEIQEVVNCLESGWLTSGPRVRQFEEQFAAAVGGRHAVAVNSCTAALHLAIEALRLKPGQAVLVPTMTFAATAEVILHQGGTPILVDCDPITLHIDLNDARRKIELLKSSDISRRMLLNVVGIIPVHVGGLMVNMDDVKRFASEHDLWVVEDAAHSLPAAYRQSAESAWRRCGEGTAAVTCFSFYANKTITTGEGGMAVTDDGTIADRIRSMSLHGLSCDAWNRYRGGGWDYRIVAAGFKYNMTDVAAAIGIHQLARAEELRAKRQTIADQYTCRLESCDAFELPPSDPNRLHSWHLFPVRVSKFSRLNRDSLIQALATQGIGTSVHWRPLHLHPYYQRTFGYQPTDCPAASQVWPSLLSLPIFPDMTERDVDRVVGAMTSVVAKCAA